MTSEHLHTGWRACHTKKNLQQEWNLDKLNPIQQTPQYNIHGIVVVKCMEQTHKLKMYPSALLDWVLDFLNVFYFFPGCSCRFKAYPVFQWYINFIHSNYNPGQKSLGQYRNIHTFLSFLGSLLKQYILFEIFLLFSLPTPYTKLKLGKILDTRVQHCLLGDGRGWTCVNCKTLQKRKCPKTFSMIVWKRGGKKNGNFFDSLKIFIKKILQN